VKLPYDIARCNGVLSAGKWREGCEDCLRRTEAGRKEWQAYLAPPQIVVFECEYRIDPDETNRPKQSS